MERMCAEIDKLQLLRRLSDLEEQAAQQVETVAGLQAEIATGVQRHHGELAKLADMAANEIVPLARKFERAQRQSKKYKKELTCVVCRAKKRSMIMLPCAHLATCKHCVDASMQQCPICQQAVVRTQQIVIE